jgi:hypothetical protein
VTTEVGVDAHEGDAVTVRRVHVGLHLEHHAGETGRLRRHLVLAAVGARHVARGRRWRQVDQRVQHLLHAEVVDAGAKEHRRLLRGDEGRLVEGGRGGGQQLDVLLGQLIVVPEAGAQRVGLRQRHDFVALVIALVGAGLEEAHLLLAQVDDAAEGLALADRPGHRHAGHAEFLLDLVEQFQRLLAFAVHLVDEGDDGRVALAADLDQPARLRLDAVGRVDHHQRGIHRGQHAVGVFRKVLVARGVEQVDHAVAIEHLHHRAGDRDAALLLDLHPVRGGMAAGLARLHRAGDVDRAGEQQQLLGQRGLAGIGVGDDREGTAAAHFAGQRAGVGGEGHGRTPGGSAPGRRMAGANKPRLSPQGRPAVRPRTQRLPAPLQCRLPRSVATLALLVQARRPGSEPSPRQRRSPAGSSRAVSGLCVPPLRSRPLRFICR